MKAARLVCKGCSAVYPLEALFACDRCFGPLEVGYDDVEPPVPRAASRPGRRRCGATPTSCPWRRPGAGCRWAARRSSAPTGSRPSSASTATSTSRPRRRTRPTRSRTGSSPWPPPRRSSSATRRSPARRRATWPGPPRPRPRRSGFRPTSSCPADLEREKIVAAAAYGATVFAVDGSYDDVNRLCSELAYERPWAFVNVNMRAYYSEGSKTIALETAEDLGWRAPDRVVAPIASGSLYTKILQGFREGRAAGLVEPGPDPIMHGAQGEGCAPVATAFAAGADARRARPAARARQVARDRQSRRRRLRARRRPLDRRHHRVGRRRRARRRHPPRRADDRASSPRPPAASRRPSCGGWRSGARSRPARPSSPTSPATA